MKKILFLIVLGIVSLNANSFALPKENDAVLREELVEPINPALSSSDVAQLKAKVNDLERRLNDMDRDRRFTEDRLRQLDRDVNDIKRRF